MTPQSANGPWSLEEFPAHLGRKASIAIEPRFGSEDWFEAYGARHAADGHEGRLVTLFSFAENWSNWEMHPNGSELVLVTRGELTLVQQDAGREKRIHLATGQYAINPPGVWHTADTTVPVTALFITSGIGTEHRAR